MKLETNKQNTLVKILFGVLTLLYFSPCSLFAKEMMRQGSRTIHLTYVNARKLINASTESGGDIEFICTAMVFEKWTIAYLDLLAKTEFPTDQVPDETTALIKEYYRAQLNQKSIEHMVPGIREVVSNQLKDYRRDRPTAPKEIETSELSLDKVAEERMSKNIDICSDPSYLRPAMDKKKYLKFSTSLPEKLRNSNNIGVDWTPTSSGGISPKQVVRSSKTILTSGTAGPNEEETKVDFQEVFESILLGKSY